MSEKIKIIATIEPRSADRKLLIQLIKSGVDIARFDFLSSDQAQIALIKNIKQVAKSKLAILLNLSNTGIKLGRINSHGQKLFDQETIILAAHSDLADININSLEYKILPLSDQIKSAHLIKSNRIFIDHDRIKFLVDKVEDNLIYTKVIKAGTVHVGDQIVVAGYIPDFQNISSDIKAAIKLKPNYLSLALLDIAALKKVKKLLKKSDIKLIIRLESLTQLKSIMSLLKLADGLFIDHQRLAWEIPEVKLKMIEKELTNKCHELDKEVLVSSLN